MPERTAGEHPELALAGEPGEVPPQGLLERRGVQGVRQRLAEGHQSLELRRAHPGLPSFGSGGECFAFHLLPLAGLVEDEDAGENCERRQQVHVPAFLEVPGDLPQKAKRPLKYDSRAGDEADDQRCVVLADKAHEYSWA